MPEWSSLFYFLVALIVIYFVYKWTYLSFRYKLPPGPFAWPIIGNYHLLMRKNAVKYIATEMRDKYGDVILMYFGSYPVIIVNNYDLAVDALVKKYPIALSGRPYTSVANIFSEGHNDITMTDYSPRWKMQRKIVHTALRKFAQGQKQHDLVKHAFDMFKRHIESNPLAATEGIDTYDVIYWLSYMLTCRSIYGADYEFDDTEFKWLRDCVEDINRTIFSQLYLDYIPGVQYLPLPSVQRLIRKVDDVHRFFERQVNEHRETLPESEDDLRDLADLIITEQKNYIKEEDEKSCLLKDVHLRQTVFGIFWAASDGMAILLHWTIGLLATYPEIQQRCYDEIEANLTLPLESFDKINRTTLPYLNAVFHEMLRFGLLGPLGFEHKALDDCKIGEYDVPKGTIVILNLYGFAYDTKYWEDPFKFNPERFLDENGDFQLKQDGFMPFGCGKRVCPGESVARQEAFSTIVALLAQFKLVWSEENELPHIEEKGDNTFIRELVHYKAKFISRN